MQRHPGVTILNCRCGRVMRSETEYAARSAAGGLVRAGRAGVQALGWVRVADPPEDSGCYVLRPAPAGALGRRAETTRASGTDWALGIEARSRALLSMDQAAEDLYREATRRLSRCRGVCRTGTDRTAREGRARTETHRADARCPDRP